MKVSQRRSGSDAGRTIDTMNEDSRELLDEEGTL
jgi:hypothetical protein